MDKRVLSVSAVVIAIALIGVGFYMGKKNSNNNEMPNARVVDTSTNKMAPNQPLANKDVDNSPPPWMNNPSNPQTQSGVNGNVPSVEAPSSTNKLNAPVSREQRIAELGRLQKEIMSGMQNGQPDIKKLTATLYKMKETQGESIGGVSISALINNLEKAQQIQELNVEVQKVSGKTGTYDQKKLDEYLKKMTKLQSEMRTDIYAAPNSGEVKAK